MTSNEALTPIGAMLGDPTQCRVYAEDVSVHWYPSATATVCHCGKVARGDGPGVETLAIRIT